MKKCIFPFVLLTFVIFGCGGLITTKAPSVTITSTTQLPVPTITIFPIPTATPKPSTSTPTLNPTVEIAATLYKQTQEANNLSSQATQQAKDSFRKTFKGMCDNADYQTTDLSPDGNWLAQDCFSDKFQVIGKDSSIIWTVKYEQIFESNEGAGAIFPVHWSKDGRYLYFTQVGCCADNDSMRTGNMLYHLDLGNGEWNMIINGYFNHYSFSPTGRRLFYIINDQAATGNPLVIHIRDLNSGIEKEFAFSDFEQAGYVVWNDDGTRLAMTTKTGNIFEENQLFSIIEINMKDDTSKVILLNNKGRVWVTHWSNNDILTIEKYSYYGTNNQYYEIAEQIYYDLNSNKLTTSIPSP